MNLPLIHAQLIESAFVEQTMLEVESLHVAYRGVDRLKDINLALPRNRITAILGPSGCGKSTLLRSLNRTLELIPGAQVTAGTVRCDGDDIYAPGTAASAVRARIGLVQQKPAPFPMSVIDNVLFGPRYHGMACGEEVARHYLERVGLWAEVKDRLRGPALALSGGQQQRLCLARTLAVRPEVLLMDEPCSALDPRATAIIEALTRELVRDFTIVIVTHNIAQASRIADHCAFMLDGKLVMAGNRNDMLVAPTHPVVRDFITGKIG